MRSEISVKRVPKLSLSVSNDSPPWSDSRCPSFQSRLLSEASLSAQSREMYAPRAPALRAVSGCQRIDSSGRFRFVACKRCAGFKKHVRRTSEARSHGAASDINRVLQGLYRRGRGVTRGTACRRCRSLQFTCHCRTTIGQHRQAFKVHIEHVHALTMASFPICCVQHRDRLCTRWDYATLS